MLILSSAISAQSLVIKGKIHDKNGKKIQAHYELSDEQETVLSGENHKMKYRLELNRSYVLKVSCEGFETKTIRFITYTEEQETFTLNFEVVLEPTVPTVAVSAPKGGNVFFDQRIGTFNYRRS